MFLPDKKPYEPRKLDDDLYDKEEILKELHYKKIQKIKQRVTEKVNLLNNLGVSKCITCRKPIGLTTKGFIVMVICLDCFDNSKSKLGEILRKEWSAKEDG